MSTSSSSPRRTRSSIARQSSSPLAAVTAGTARSASLRHVTVQRRSSPTDEPSSPSPNSTTGEAVQSILKARKCWRSIKGKEEAVWPPELEAALIEGLEKYKPAESKSTRVLGRFPMRNKFVADHIFDTTGVRRTPKQVGSRIQQLRDTNSGKHILKAISDRHYEMMHPKKHDGHEQSGTSSHATPFKTEPVPHSLSPTPSHIYIQTLSPSAAWRSQALDPYSPSPIDLHSPDDPRPLSMIDPTVTFTSAGRPAVQSSFQVFKDGRLVHEEAAGVTVSAAPQPSVGGSSSMYLYSTSLVPGYWAQLCAAEDPASYTIYHEVVRIPYSTPLSQDTPPDVLLSVYYHFLEAFPLSSPPLSPYSSCGSELDIVKFSPEPSPLLEPIMDVTYMQDSLDPRAVPGLIQPCEDGYTSQPGSPMDIPPVGISQWGYSAPTLITPELSATCDSYFDPAPYSPHVFQ